MNEYLMTPLVLLIVGVLAFVLIAVKWIHWYGSEDLRRAKAVARAWLGPIRPWRWRVTVPSRSRSTVVDGEQKRRQQLTAAAGLSSSRRAVR